VFTVNRTAKRNWGVHGAGTITVPGHIALWVIAAIVEEFEIHVYEGPGLSPSKVNS
jgi:hypothetical protein